MLVQQADVRTLLPELSEIESLRARAGDFMRVSTAATVKIDGQHFAVPVITMGSDDPGAPAIGLFGGVHGVERIGMEVVLAYMSSLLASIGWAPALKQQIESLHLVFMPAVNPGGIMHKSRCNPNGVDLMRNAPIDADGPVSLLAGGQRLSRRLPWYRGVRHAPMEVEAQALCNVVEEHLTNRPFSIALDCHSGYGRKDYIWFPYAGSRAPFPHAAEVLALKNLFDRAHPHHTYYAFEPQSLHYMTHGDIWDYLHKRFLQRNDGVFLPLTLEMGAWQWIRKNPRQLLGFPSLFNPVLPHRHRRILRRHQVLMEFLLRAVHGYKQWLPHDDARTALTEMADEQWYSNHA